MKCLVQDLKTTVRGSKPFQYKTFVGNNQYMVGVNLIGKILGPYRIETNIHLRLAFAKGMV